MKRVLLGLVYLFSACLAQGGGEALYKQGAAVYKSDPKAAFGLFVQAAEAGNPSAMTGAGHCCETGIGTKVDYAKAIEWYEKAVAHNSLKACEGLARIYASCDDPEFHDGEKAVKYASVIARKKPRDADAQILLAHAYLRDMQVDLAVKTITHAMRYTGSGDRSRELNAMAKKYKSGEPVPAEATDAWILRAADANVFWAVTKLAHMASDPGGSMYNPQLALKMCQKGIEAGKFEMYVRKGSVYLEMGELDEAYSCYEFAVKKKVPHGRRDSPELYLRHYLKESSANVFQQAEKKWKGYTIKGSPRTSKASEPSSNRAMLVKCTEWCMDAQCSDCYYSAVEDIKVDPNLKEACFLYKIADKKGHVEARARRAKIEQSINVYKHLLENSEGLDDHSLAKALIVEARKYMRNDVVPKNLDRAVEIYEKAYGLEAAPSTAYSLALIYKKREQTDLAITWLERAHASGLRGATKYLIRLYACSADPDVWNGDKAVEYATVLVEENSTDHVAHSLLACAQARSGQFIAAIKSMKKAQELLRASQPKNNSLKKRYEQQYHLFNHGEPWPPKKD
ncbi:MAG: sel1 repeat family protein [Verrucomicrobia bacterium]|nr:sel1 repeat family protein [Verrucomicrobiota bacterium]